MSQNSDTKLIQATRDPGKSLLRVQRISQDAAKGLADLYLPVYLRDFYLNLHELVQTFLYRQSTSPEEFFTLVLQEQVRHNNNRYYSRSGAWAKGVVIFDELIEVNDIKLLEAPTPTPPLDRPTGLGYPVCSG